MNSNFYRMLPQLGFGKAVKLASGRLVDFGSRSRRSEFWWWMLLVLLCNMVAGMVLPSYSLASTVASIVIMFCGLAVTARRLQDCGHSAAWVYVSYGLGIATNLFSCFALAEFYEEYAELFASGYVLSSDDMVDMMTPYFGSFAIYMLLWLLWSVSSLIVFIMVLMDGKPEANKWGPSPKYVPAE